MKDSKAATIIGYILIGIILIPIAAVALYVIVGLSLYLPLFITDRVKNGRADIKEGRTYKTVSTLILLAGVAIYAFTGDITQSFLTWQTWGIMNAIVFAGMLPLCYYQYLRLKHKI